LVVAALFKKATQLVPHLKRVTQWYRGAAISGGVGAETSRPKDEACVTPSLCSVADVVDRQSVEAGSG